MSRCSFALVLALLLLMGCSGQNSTADGTPDVDDPSDCCAPPPEPDDRNPEDNAPIDPPPANTVTDPGAITTPTEDDSDERAKAREMDIAGLITALNDPKLGSVATDELASRGADAVKPLIDALGSDDAVVQQKAIYTLGQLGPAAKDALPKLQQLADNGSTEVVQDSAKFAIDAIDPK